MTARGSDRVWWIPPGWPLRAPTRADQHVLGHHCPTACIAAPTHRDQLDPMALGTCRFCGERLPVAPDKEKAESDA